MKTTVKKSGNGKRRSTVYGKQNNKLDCYERFTQLILEKLEQGVVPWRKPWNALGLPSNYLTKKPYHGINLWLLLCFDHQYPYYLTFRQVQQLGGKVRKGAKALPICYWNFVFRDKLTGNVIPENQLKNYPPEQIVKSGYLKEFRVFPIEQVEGID